MNLLEVRLDRLKSILGTDFENGLTTEQVLRNRREFGENLCYEKKNTFFDLLKKVFGDVIMLLFLLVNLFDYLENQNVLSLVAFILIPLLYGTFVFFTHLYISETKKKIDRFSRSRYHVRRSGMIVSVDKASLVPGDILLLEKGDVMPCDGIILKHSAFKILEASVTGRRIPVFKRSHDEVNEESGYPYFECILFAGSVVLTGSAKVFVCNTGRDIFDSENFTISRQNSTVPQIYEVAMELKRQISLIWVLTSFLVFTIGIFWGHGIFRTFVYSVATVVAAFPDILEHLCDLAISYMTRKMFSDGVILRNPGAVERLSDANCVFVNSSDYLYYSHPAAGGYCRGDTLHDYRNDPLGASSLITCMLLTQSSREYFSGKKDEWKSEKAIMSAAAGIGIQKRKLDKDYMRINLYDFDPKYGFSCALLLRDNVYRLIIRGKPESVLERCTRIEKDGCLHPFTNPEKDVVRANVSYLTNTCEKIYAVGVLDLASPTEGDQREFCRKMVFLGLFGLSTPISAAAANAVNICQKAGIHTYLLTDDYPETVSMLSKSVSIIGENDYQNALTFEKYQRMDRGIFITDLEKYKAYCGFSVEEKQNIVKYHKNNGNITVSLTGGLYDTLPQMESDISIVGVEEKLKAVRLNADILVKEKRFELVPLCINWSRIFYRNIVHLMQFVLFLQFALGFTVLISLITDGYNPFSMLPMILSVFFVSVISGINIFYRKPGARLEDNLEVLKDDRLASMRSLMITPLLSGFTQALCTLLSLRIALYASGDRDLASSAALITFILSCYISSISYKFDSPLFKRILFFGGSEFVTFLCTVLLIFLLIASPLVLLWQNEIAILKFWPVFFSVVLAMIPVCLIEWMKILKKDVSAFKA